MVFDGMVQTLVQPMTNGVLMWEEELHLQRRNKRVGVNDILKVDPAVGPQQALSLVCLMAPSLQTENLTLNINFC